MRNDGRLFSLVCLLLHSTTANADPEPSYAAAMIQRLVLEYSRRSRRMITDKPSARAAIGLTIQLGQQCGGAYRPLGSDLR